MRYSFHRRVFAGVLVAAAALLTGAEASAVVMQTTNANTGTFNVSNNDVLQGAAVLVNDLNNIRAEEGVTSANPFILTNGGFGPAGLPGGPGTVNEVVAVHNGTMIDYILPLHLSPGGFNINQISTYTGWRDGGRDAQQYTVAYSTAADPTSFIDLATVNFNPPATNPISTEVQLTDTTGLLAGNVARLRFNFPSTENGFVGYREIDVLATDAGGMEVGFAAPTVMQMANNSTFNVAGDDLINGLLPAVNDANLIRAEEGVTTADPAALTNGEFGAAGLPGGNQDQVVAIHNGAVLTYDLDLDAFPNGYTVTGVDIYSGWRDPGRDNINVVAEYSAVGDPSLFFPLGQISFDPGGIGSPASAAAFLKPGDGGFLATGVAQVRFTFPGQENGYVGYRELDVQGFGAQIPEPASATLALLAAGALTHRRRRTR